METCKICKSKSSFLSKVLILEKFNINYYKCNNCNFIQTEEPYWMDEAYSSPITSLDLGLLNRNILIIPILRVLIFFFYNKKKFFLDYGGGYGVLVRLMRDYGFNFLRQDHYCQNLFANGFDINDFPSIKKFEVLTAFEVFEHLESPLEEVAKMLELSDNIFFSTELQPTKSATTENWWYFTPSTGQHISLYSKESLLILAQRVNCKLYSDGKTLHLLSRNRKNKVAFKLATNSAFAKLFTLFFRVKDSYLDKDYNQILRKGKLS